MRPNSNSARPGKAHGQRGGVFDPQTGNPAWRSMKPEPFRPRTDPGFNVAFCARRRCDTILNPDDRHCPRCGLRRESFGGLPAAEASPSAEASPPGFRGRAAYWSLKYGGLVALVVVLGFFALLAAMMGCQ